MYWDKFSCYLKNKYLKGQVQRMEVSILGLPIKIRFDIYSDINNMKPDRINCITVTLYTRTEKGFKILEKKFNPIQKSFKLSDGISVYQEPENIKDYNKGKEFRIVVSKSNTNIYSTECLNWINSFKWMDTTICKMLKILFTE